MRHGEKFRDHNGEEYMDDHINGVNWHVPDSGDVLDENGNWRDDTDQ